MGTSLIFWIFCLILSTGLAQTDALSQLETCGDDTDGVCLLQLKHHEGVMNEGAGVDLHVVQGAAAGGDQSLQIPSMEFDGFTPGMSPTVGMGPMGMWVKFSTINVHHKIYNRIQ